MTTIQRGEAQTEMRAQLTRRWECHVMTVALVAVCLEIAPPIFALPTVSPAAVEVPTLTCGAHGTDSVTLRWAAVSGATLYEVVVGAPGTSIEHSPYASVTATPAQASGLVVSPRSHLYYRLDRSLQALPTCAPFTSLPRLVRGTCIHRVFGVTVVWLPPPPYPATDPTPH